MLVIAADRASVGLVGAVSGHPLRALNHKPFEPGRLLVLGRKVAAQPDNALVHQAPKEAAVSVPTVQAGTAQCFERFTVYGLLDGSTNQQPAKSVWRRYMDC